MPFSTNIPDSYIITQSETLSGCVLLNRVILRLRYVSFALEELICFLLAFTELKGMQYKYIETTCLGNMVIYGLDIN